MSKIFLNIALTVITLLLSFSVNFLRDISKDISSLKVTTAVLSSEVQESKVRLSNLEENFR